MMRPQIIGGIRGYFWFCKGLKILKDIYKKGDQTLNSE
jgi:hypothetical protein